MNIDEQFARYFSKSPRIHPTAFIARSADIIGDVEVGEQSSIWFQTVLRADINRIVVGPRSNIQDGSVVHLADDYGVEIGELVTIGHSAIIHACTIGSEVLIGMGATILDGVEIGSRSIIGANSLVTQHQKIPPGSLVFGSPAKVVRMLDETDQQKVKDWALKYVEVSRRFLAAAQSGTAKSNSPV